MPLSIGKSLPRLHDPRICWYGGMASSASDTQWRSALHIPRDLAASRERFSRVVRRCRASKSDDHDAARQTIASRIYWQTWASFSHRTYLGAGAGSVLSRSSSAPPNSSAAQRLSIPGLRRLLRLIRPTGLPCRRIRRSHLARPCRMRRARIQPARTDFQWRGATDAATALAASTGCTCKGG